MTTQELCDKVNNCLMDLYLAIVASESSIKKLEETMKREGWKK